MSEIQPIYQKQKSALRRCLTTAATLDDVTSCIEGLIDTVRTELSPTLSVPQARVVTSTFEGMRQLLGVYNAVTIEAEQPAPTQPSVNTPLLVRILMALFGRDDTSTRLRSTTGRLVGQKVALEVDAGAVILQLEQSFAAVDHAIEAAQPGATPAEQKRPMQRMELDLELLEFLQNLVGEAKDNRADIILKRLQQLPRILDGYQIEVAEYDPEHQVQDIDPEQLFSFEPAVDPQQSEYVTLVPALVRQNEVLLRGRVVTPTRG